jgi:RNA polymerase sigma-70 factor (ECF subfamily)
MIYRLGLRLCHDDAFAEDLVQETFAHALQGWDKFDGRCEPSSWLYTIAVHAHRRVQRRRAGQPRQMDCVCRADSRTAADDLADPAEVTERLEWVRKAVNGLAIRYRLPVVLRYYGDLTTGEIAQVLSVSEGTIRCRLFRGRQILAEALRDGVHPADAERGTDSDKASPSRAKEMCDGCASVFGSLKLADKCCREFIYGCGDG